MRRITAGAAFAGAALGLFTAGARPAFAADLVVGKGKQYTTIQAAIDAAGPGDRILVGPGVYLGALTIPAGKDGLRLVGRRATIDAHDGMSSGSYTVEVDSDGVQIEGFSLRNATSAQVDVQGDDFVLRRCMLRNSEEYGVYVHGERPTVEGCSILGTLDRAIYVNGNGARVSGTRIGNCGEGAIYIDGDDAVVEDTTTRVIEDSPAVRIYGLRGTVRGVRVTNNDDDGVNIEGDGAVVEDCTVTQARSSGISVTGAGVRVDGNVVRSCRSSGIVISGSGISVTGNDVARIATGNTGISVHLDSGRSEDAPTATLEGNKVADTNGFGIAVEGAGTVTLRRCSVRRTGAGYAGGFYVRTVSAAVEDCVSVDAGDTAFQIESAGDTGLATLLRCVATGAAGDGFQISAVGTTLTDCRAELCGGEGLHNTTGGTTATGCRFRRNRIDVATEGGAAFGNDVAAANEFVTGGADTLPEVDFPVE